VVSPTHRYVFNTAQFVDDITAIRNAITTETSRLLFQRQSPKLKFRRKKSPKMRDKIKILKILSTVFLSIGT